LAAYDELVPQFEALFAQQGSWQKFYDACQALAKLPRDERRAALAAQTRTAAQ
jgi:predicted aminopeptidase